VGKSTLLLMVAGRLADRGLPVLYASGEESAQQIQIRAKRLGIDSKTLFLLPTARFEDIAEAARKLRPVLMIIDSVQTVSVDDVPAHAGSVSQVRAVAHQAMVFAKLNNISTFLVGHITKSGDLAGPKIMEHFVDTVLYFEGDGRTSLRALRTVKNRFGAAGELGFFEMSGSGLIEVPDASGRLLAERTIGVAGTSVVATMEGSRPLLAEIQALVGPPGCHTPARTCVGVDRARLLMLLAVLQKHGVSVHDRNIFVNVTGGIQISEPAADLSIALAVFSSFTDVPLPDDCIVLGELGLVGEVRSVPQPLLRMKEAARYGFVSAIAHRSATLLDQRALKIRPVERIADLLAELS
jgi:DNA repair protein RadA/Sms